MDSARPLGDVPRVSLAEQRRLVRLPVVRPIIGHALPMNLPVLLRDISAGGFSGIATITLTPKVVYDFRFAIHPRTLVLRARVAHAMRVSGGPNAGYLLGFAFVDTKWDQAAIEALIAEATIAAP